MQLTKEQLIEELKNDDEVYYSKKEIEFFKKGQCGRIKYYPQVNRATIVDYNIHGLSPDCILELFRKWK